MEQLTRQSETFDEQPMGFENRASRGRKVRGPATRYGNL